LAGFVIVVGLVVSIPTGAGSTTNGPPPSTSILIPSNGATLSGSTYLDASATNATSVEFRLFGGVYGFSAPVVCTTTPTLFGWLCAWDTTTVPDGSYVLVSEASDGSASTFSLGVGITVNHSPSLADLAGSFSGTTSLTSGTGGCAFVEQVFDAGYLGSSAVGSVTLHLDGCVVSVSPLPFAYIGTFAITTSAGTLAGNEVGPINNVPVTPYDFELTLTVVSGTGAFAGTTGTINVSIQWSGGTPVSGSVTVE
jgi:hypothetical protein